MTEKTEHPSHLTDSQINGKPYSYKARCVWCNAPYNTELSDARNYMAYCSAECARIDDLIASGYED